MVISTTTFLKDVIIFLRNDLRTNITDSLGRTDGIGFVMTSYPQREVKYPLITVVGRGMDTRKLGMQSETQLATLRVEIRIWARNIEEKDDLTQKVINRIRQNEFGASSLSAEEIYGNLLLSAADVDEVGKGQPKSKILEYEFKIILSG